MAWTASIASVGWSNGVISASVQYGDGQNSLGRGYTVRTKAELDGTIARALADLATVDAELAAIQTGAWTAPPAAAWPHIATLQAELTGDPLSRGYAGMTDGEVAVSLNAVDRRGVLIVDDMTEYLLIAGVLQKVEDAVAHHATAAVREVALGMKLTIERYSSINMADAARYAAISAQLDGMIAAGLMTTEQKTAALAFGENRQSRASEIGLPEVTAANVTETRAA